MRAVLDYCKDGIQQSVSAGALVIHEGQTTGHLYVLIEGRLEVVKGDTVVATISEPGGSTVSCPNCSSIATRSSRSRSKISFPLIAMVALNSFYRRDAEIAGADRSPIRVMNESQTQRPLRLGGRISSVRPVIRELHINSKVVLLHQGDDFL